VTTCDYVSAKGIGEMRNNRNLTFNLQGSVHPKYILIYIQQDAMLHILFISGNCSTCFRWYLHPSSGAHTTVSTASGTVKPLLLPVAIVEELESSSNSSMIATGSSNGLTVPDAVDTVVCAPDDRWRYHPKHVQQFLEINKLRNVASFWMYIRIYKFDDLSNVVNRIASKL